MARFKVKLRKIDKSNMKNSFDSVLFNFFDVFSTMDNLNFLTCLFALFYLKTLFLIKKYLMLLLMLRQYLAGNMPAVL